MATSITMTDEEQRRRNKFLRRRKIGMQFALAIMIIVSCSIIYLLQRFEKIDDQTMTIVVSVLTVLLLGGFLMYRRFARILNLDMSSDQKIMTTGIVVRSNFIGNTVYPTDVYGDDNQKYITLEIDGRWVTLSNIQLKRLVHDVTEVNRIYLRDEFQVEMTPFGHHIMQLRRIIP